MAYIDYGVLEWIDKFRIGAIGMKTDPQKSLSHFTWWLVEVLVVVLLLYFTSTYLLVADVFLNWLKKRMW